MRTLKDDDGVVAVITAVLLVVLLGFGAIVVDLGALYAERRQLQNGADAAAIAVAQDCAAGSCGSASATATTFANANSNDGTSVAGVTFPTASSARVDTSTREPGGSLAVTHWLAPVIGIDASQVTARATASWGAIGGAGTMPIAASLCEWDLFTGGAGIAALPTPDSTIYLHTQSQAATNACGGPAGQTIPGGFGWLDVDGSGTCNAQVSVGTVGGDTGTPPPGPASTTGCTDAFWASLIGQTTLLPIFEAVSGSGINAVYTIRGFAAFVLTGYRFNTDAVNAPCGPPNTCVRGHFTTYYSYGSQPSTSAPSFGATTVSLTD